MDKRLKHLPRPRVTHAVSVRAEKVVIVALGAGIAVQVASLVGLLRLTTSALG